MDRETILKGVIDCIADCLVLEDSKIFSEATIFGELGAESLDFMAILFKLEATFGVEIGIDDFDFLSKLGLPLAEVVNDDFLTSQAKERLLIWLPELPTEKAIKASDLMKFLSVDSIVSLVERKSVSAKGVFHVSAVRNEL